MRPVLLFCILLHGSAFSLTLKEAEESAMANDPKTKSYDDSLKSVEARKSGVVSGLFPKLTIEASKTYQVPQKIHKTQTALEAKATFQNPIWHLSQHDSINADKKLLELDKSAHYYDLVNSVRTSYFKIKVLELQIASAKKYHSTLYDVFRSIETKYKQGRIQVLDKDRSQVQVLRQEQTLNSLNAQLESQKVALAKKINAKEKLGIHSLNTELPTVFKPLPANFSAKDIPAIKREQYITDKNRSLLKSANSEFFPDFYISATKNDIIDPVTESRFVAYSAGLTWKLSPGSYYSRKEAQAKIASSKNLVEYEKLQGEMDLYAMVSDINSTVADLASQDVIVKSLERIAKQSLVQYQAGYTPLTTYYLEFETLSEAEDKLLNKRFKLIELYTKLAKYLEDDTIFYNGMVL